MIFSHGNLALALGERLAVLQRNQARNFFTASMQFIGNLVEQFPASFSRKVPPAQERRLCVCNGLRHPGPVHRRHPGESFPGGRVVHLVCRFRNR